MLLVPLIHLRKWATLCWGDTPLLYGRHFILGIINTRARRVHIVTGGGGGRCV
jgi:hypothetical protein